MTAIPAICDNCSTIFPSAFGIEQSFGLELNNCKSGPCPVCGSDGTVPNGSYSEFNNFLSVVKVDAGEDLDKLFSILTNLQINPQISLNEIENEIENQTPQYSGIVQLIADIIKKNNITPAVAISFLMTLFGLCYPIYQDLNDDTDEKIDKLYEEQKLTNQYLSKIADNTKQNNRSESQMNKEKKRDTKKKKVFKKRKPKTNYKKK